jgi:hypothetical protein
MRVEISSPTVNIVWPLNKQAKMIERTTTSRTVSITSM